MFKVQKKALRIIYHAGYRAHTNNLFIKAKLLKVFDIIDSKMIEIVYKARHQILPDRLKALFTDRGGRYNLRGTDKFKQRLVSTRLVQSSVSVRGVNLWNELDSEVKKQGSLRKFKQKLRGEMIRKYRQLEKT